MTRRHDLAEDLVQDTYMNAFRAFRSFEPGTNLRAWLFRIMRNSFIARFRLEKHRHVEVGFGSIESIADDGDHRSTFSGLHRSDPESTVVSAILPEELRRALAELPSRYREAVEYAWLDDLSYQEIAQRMHVPIGTVMSRIYRGRKQLRKSLYGFARSRRLVAPRARPHRLVA